MKQNNTDTSSLITKNETYVNELAGPSTGFFHVGDRFWA